MDRTGKLRWVFYDFPTDGTALRAAMVARSLPPQRYEPFINALFATQNHWAYATATCRSTLAGRQPAGMDRPAFDQAMADTHLRDWIVAREGRRKSAGTLMRRRAS